MDFEYSDRSKALLEKLNKFMDEVIYPAEPIYEEQMEKAKDRWQLPPIIEECKAEAKKRGLWNMFLPADRESGDTHGTMGLSNLDYAPICEVLGRSSIASEAVNCSAPDTGNMEVFRALRHRGAQGEVAEAAAQRRDPFLLRHDRAGGGLVGRAQCRVPHRVGRQRLCHQRPQVVVVGHGRPTLQGHHPDGQERSQRAGLPPAVDDRGAARRARHQDREDAARVRL
jgi:hypothetical protein